MSSPVSSVACIDVRVVLPVVLFSAVYTAVCSAAFSAITQSVILMKDSGILFCRCHV